MASPHMLRALSEMAKHGGNYFGQVHSEGMKSKRIADARAESDRVRKEGWGREDDIRTDNRENSALLLADNREYQAGILSDQRNYNEGVKAEDRKYQEGITAGNRSYLDRKDAEKRQLEAEIKLTDASAKEQTSINDDLDATDKRLTAIDAKLAADFTGKIAIMEQMEDLLTGKDAINTGPANNLFNESVAKWVETKHSEKLAVFNTLTSAAVLDKSQELSGSVSNADMNFLTLAGAGVKLTTAANLRIVRFQMGVLRNAQENLRSRRAYFDKNKNYLKWQPTPYMTPERIAEVNKIIEEGTVSSGKNLGRGGIAKNAAIKKNNDAATDALINKYTTQPQ